jgi:phosphatidylglycerophosphate synthase
MEPMDPLSRLISIIRDFCRALIGQFAVVLDRLTGGRLSPNVITYVSFLVHIPIAWLIAEGYNYWAAGLLLVFGLFDALDGAIARLQKKAGPKGMLLDASTDRIKEVFLYIGCAYALIGSGQPYWAVWAVAACGASLVVSYVKAKGETAFTGIHLSANEINRLFSSGIMQFEVRMTILLIGLVTNQLRYAIAVIAVASTLTALRRLTHISRKL